MEILPFFLLSKLAENENDNVVISPLSITQTLAMVELGAKGEALTAILKLTGPLDELLHENYTSNAMILANSVWSSVLREDYLKTVVDRMPAAQAFRESPTKERINNWVDENTKHLIDRILEDDPPKDGAVLVNAAYFKDSWKVKFNTFKTRPMQFHLADGSTKLVSMMTAESPETKQNMNVFQYFSDGDYQVVSIPYSQPEYSAVIALPSETKCNAALVSTSYETWMAGMKATPGVVLLPKFDVEGEVRDITGLLEEEGLQLSGDYSGMSDGPLQISSVFHKAVLKVNEEGTEAAAASAMVMNRAFVMPPPDAFEMVVNRPFYFIVKHNLTGRMAFIGKISNPDDADSTK
ncbi:hypothetical protein FOL47_009103 [Perkinsus chesapeaki]|uniref:Serpin domain-containing protein n=1 Tax=Perkinsus chesapeaki TaxID=330153 RepID=A0A7J6LAJ9_PERCH|nr:hypothetical protein FOL47_009103 [Perkinsus chesapeaki]